MNLYLSDAVTFVRARIDELPYNNDDMISPADDDRNFDKTVEKLLPEAAEVTIMAAPAELLEPQDAMTYKQGSALPSGIGSVSVDNSVVTVMIPLGTGFLRLVAFKSDDSEIYVTNPVPFNSPEARMQANGYVRGTYDNPVLVERRLPNATEFKYYSIRSSSPGFTIYKIDKPSYSGDMTIFCPKQLEVAVLNRLVGMVLDAYGDQRSQLFYQKSNSYQA